MCKLMKGANLLCLIVILLMKPKNLNILHDSACNMFRVVWLSHHASFLCCKERTQWPILAGSLSPSAGTLLVLGWGDEQQVLSKILSCAVEGGFLISSHAPGTPCIDRWNGTIQMSDVKTTPPSNEWNVLIFSVLKILVVVQYIGAFWLVGWQKGRPERQTAVCTTSWLAQLHTTHIGQPLYQ